MKKQILFAILFLIMTACLLACFVACKDGGNVTLAFDDGEAVTITIGERLMLPFTASKELSSSQKVILSSSDTSVVAINEKGYITAVGKGTAELTLSVEGVSKPAKIVVTVAVPQITADNFYYVNANSNSVDHLFVEMDDTVPAGTSLYIEAYSDQQFVSGAIAHVQPNHRAYLPLKDLKMQNGIYRVGVACVDHDDTLIKNVYLTDAYTSYSFVEGEEWTYILTTMEEDSVLAVDKRFTYGGARITLDIAKNSEGKIENPFIRVNAISGNMWSVKLRIGEGIDSTYEEVILNDSKVSDASYCEIDLNKFPKYVRDGKVSVVIYAIQGDLKLGDIVNYSKDNSYSMAVEQSNYKPLESVELSVSDKLYVGNEYPVEVDFSPSKASFKNLKLVASNDNVSVVSNDKIFINKSGECELTYVGFDGRVYGSLKVNGIIKVTDINFTANAGNAVVDLSSGTYDLGKIANVIPVNADATIKYNIVSGTSQGATVSANGIISFSNVGQIKVELTTDNNVNVKETFTLTVVESYLPTQSLTINSATNELQIGDCSNLSVTVVPQNATYGNVFWSSSDSDIVSVVDGCVTALKAGVVTISAFAEDGCSYDSVTLTVRALKNIAINPTEYSYGIVELSKEIVAGDKVTIKVHKDGAFATLVEQTITVAETASHSVGNMEIQRRLMFALDNDIFNDNDTYVFEVIVTRNGQPLQGYGFGSLSMVKATANITTGQWVNGYFDCQPSIDGSSVIATLASDGWGNIQQNISQSDILNAKYLVVQVADRTSGLLAIKMMIDGTEIALTAGDCSAVGVYKLDLSAYADLIANAQSITINLYAIGAKDSTVTFANVFFVTEEIKL